MHVDFQPLTALIEQIPNATRHGVVTAAANGIAEIRGLSVSSRMGSIVSITQPHGPNIMGEVVTVSRDIARILLYDSNFNPAIGDSASLCAGLELRPHSSWMGRTLDAFGKPLDGLPVSQGDTEMQIVASPPQARMRRRLGRRLSTGFAVFDTIIPMVRGQRLGVFSGSGVGKTTLIGEFAKNIEADCVVIGLIGERGREINDFVSHMTESGGLARSVIIAATSDQSALLKRRAAWTATATAEYYRNQGMQVLLIIDSITRFADAHREIALHAGEIPSLRAYPPSTANVIAALAERAGPGTQSTGDITAIYSVLVAGSDFEEPISDIARGVLDGHIVLDRNISQRNRFPAVDVLQSVSRSLPEAASDEENDLIAKFRRILNTYEQVETLVTSGMYQHGSDPEIDNAIKIWPGLDKFVTVKGMLTEANSFELLRDILNPNSSEFDSAHM